MAVVSPRPGPRLGRGVVRRLPASDRAPAAARRVVAERLRVWRLERLVGDVALIVSELVTNARVHGVGSVTLRMEFTVGTRGPACVHVEVHDFGMGPRTRDAAEPDGGGADRDVEHGRGLPLVAGIADRWGVRNSARGKGCTVWADRFVAS
ncbi:ATP-binding protein [Streptomyces sp. PTM05]|uniref:ATP-binding protein n=1 Tax=Streptantibioticus parmotrematis TaxID=2873249 RepID=A0ABS7QXV1_9ACTN|nr:ATP-binding protein [Streptantibioticus parmotrematis]MBY8886619.1 ATP-binding protein [Streptantibioticus parmotrematis]